MGQYLVIRDSIMKPIILGIETSTDACSVALSANDQIYAEFVIEPQAHSKIILDMVAAVCIQAGVELEQIEAIAFGQGPGSFTGVRIAASVTQGLAFGLGKHAIGISSLAALAQQAHNKLHAVQVLALLDARMQEIYCGKYSFAQSNLATALAEDCLIKPEILIVDAPEHWMAVGTACAAYAASLQQYNPELIVEPSILYPRAQEVVQLALAEFAQANFLSAEQIVPAYIRNDVAQTGKKNPD